MVPALRQALLWLCFGAASVCWVACVFAYDSWGTGDRLQLAAALAWSLGNVCALPGIFEPADAAAPPTVAAAAGSLLPRRALIWLLQCTASGCWVASVCVCGSWDTGDRLQLAAALSWCASNLCAAPDIRAPPADEPSPAEGSLLPREAVAWLCQCAASGCWVVSVFVYFIVGEFETGDRLQLAAALSWSLGNVVAAPDIFQPKRQPEPGAARGDVPPAPPEVAP